MANPFVALESVPIMATITDMLQRQANLKDTQARTNLITQQTDILGQQVAAEKKFNDGLARLADAKVAQDASDKSLPPDFAAFASTEMGKPIADGYRSESQSAKQNRQLAAVAVDAGDYVKAKQFQKEAEDADNRARQWYVQGQKLAQDQHKELASIAGSYADDGSNVQDIVDAVKSIDPKKLSGSQFNRDGQGNIIAGPGTAKAFSTIADTSMTRSEQISGKREAEKIAQDKIKNEQAAVREKERDKMDDARLAAMQHAANVQDKRLALALGQTEGAVPAKDQDKHGDDYLATLPTSLGAEVKAIAEGRQNISSMGYRGPARAAMMERVNQYDPNFDQTSWGARAATRRDFGSGQAAKNITAINTAIGHLGTMDELSTAMKNHDMVAANKVVNTIATQLGDPRINNYQLAATAVSDEMMRVFRQVGASDAEAARWEKAFKSDLSTGQLKGSIGVAVKLLGSRAEALHDQWTNTMGDVVKAPEVLHPRSQEVLKKIGVKMDTGETKPVAPAKLATRDQVTARGIAYEPDKYDYGIDENGNLMRKKK